MGANALSKRLGMQFAYEGIVSAGCPPGTSDFVQYEANAATGKVVQLIKCVLAFPLSAQAKLLLLRKSVQLKILHSSRVTCKSDAVGGISEVEQEILAGILHIMKCSDAQVDTAQISLPIWLGGLGVHLMSACNDAACDAAFLAAAALTHRDVIGGSEHFDPFKGDSGVELPAMLSGLYDKVQPFICLLYTSPSPRDRTRSRMPSSA